MRRHVLEWDPSWDDDWQAAQPDLERLIEEGCPPEPTKAVEYYKYGFIMRKKHPFHPWPEIEREIYQDYMTGQLELTEGEDWEEARRYIKAGWLRASRQT